MKLDDANCHRVDSFRRWKPATVNYLMEPGLLVSNGGMSLFTWEVSDVFRSR